MAREISEIENYYMNRKVQKVVLREKEGKSSVGFIKKS